MEGIIEVACTDYHCSVIFGPGKRPISVTFLGCSFNLLVILLYSNIFYTLLDFLWNSFNFISFLCKNVNNCMQQMKKFQECMKKNKVYLIPFSTKLLVLKLLDFCFFFELLLFRTKEI